MGDLKMLYLIDVKTRKPFYAYETVEEYEEDCKKYPNLAHCEKVEEIEETPSMDDICAPWLRYELFP